MFSRPVPARLGGRPSRPPARRPVFTLAAVVALVALGLLRCAQPSSAAGAAADPACPAYPSPILDAPDATGDACAAEETLTAFHGPYITSANIHRAGIRIHARVAATGDPAASITNNADPGCDCWVAGASSVPILDNEGLYNSTYDAFAYDMLPVSVGVPLDVDNAWPTGGLLDITRAAADAANGTCVAVVESLPFVVQEKIPGSDTIFLHGNNATGVAAARAVMAIPDPDVGVFTYTAGVAEYPLYIRPVCTVYIDGVPITAGRCSFTLRRTVKGTAPHLADPAENPLLDLDATRPVASASEQYATDMNDRFPIAIPIATPGEYTLTACLESSRVLSTTTLVYYSAALGTVAAEAMCTTEKITVETARSTPWVLMDADEKTIDADVWECDTDKCNATVNARVGVYTTDTLGCRRSLRRRRATIRSRGDLAVTVQGTLNADGEVVSRRAALSANIDNLARGQTAAMDILACVDTADELPPTKARSALRVSSSSSNDGGTTGLSVTSGQSLLLYTSDGWPSAPVGPVMASAAYVTYDATTDIAGANSTLPVVSRRPFLGMLRVNPTALRGTWGDVLSGVSSYAYGTNGTTIGGVIGGVIHIDLTLDVSGDPFDPTASATIQHRVTPPYSAVVCSYTGLPASWSLSGEIVRFNAVSTRCGASASDHSVHVDFEMHDYDMWTGGGTSSGVAFPADVPVPYYRFAALAVGDDLLDGAATVFNSDQYPNAEDSDQSMPRAAHDAGVFSFLPRAASDGGFGPLVEGTPFTLAVGDQLCVSLMTSRGLLYNGIPSCCSYNVTRCRDGTQCVDCATNTTARGCYTPPGGGFVVIDTKTATGPKTPFVAEGEMDARARRGFVDQYEQAAALDDQWIDPATLEPHVTYAGVYGQLQASGVQLATISETHRVFEQSGGTGTLCTHMPAVLYAFNTAYGDSSRNVLLTGDEIYFTQSDDRDATACQLEGDTTCGSTPDSACYRIWAAPGEGHAAGTGTRVVMGTMAGYVLSPCETPSAYVAAFGVSEYNAAASVVGHGTTQLRVAVEPPTWPFAHIASSASTAVAPDWLTTLTGVLNGATDITRGSGIDRYKLVRADGSSGVIAHGDSVYIWPDASATGSTNMLCLGELDSATADANGLRGFGDIAEVLVAAPACIAGAGVTRAAGIRTHVAGAHVATASTVDTPTGLLTYGTTRTDVTLTAGCADISATTCILDPLLAPRVGLGGAAVFNASDTEAPVAGGAAYTGTAGDVARRGHESGWATDRSPTSIAPVSTDAISGTAATGVYRWEDDGGSPVAVDRGTAVELSTGRHANGLLASSVVQKILLHRSPRAVGNCSSVPVPGVSILCPRDLVPRVYTVWLGPDASAGDSLTTGADFWLRTSETVSDGGVCDGTAYKDYVAIGTTSAHVVAVEEIGVSRLLGVYTSMAMPTITDRWLTKSSALTSGTCFINPGEWTWRDDDVSGLCGLRTFAVSRIGVTGAAPNAAYGTTLVGVTATDDVATWTTAQSAWLTALETPAEQIILAASNESSSYALRRMRATERSLGNRTHAEDGAPGMLRQICISDTGINVGSGVADVWSARWRHLDTPGELQRDVHGDCLTGDAAAVYANTAEGDSGALPLTWRVRGIWELTVVTSAFDTIVLTTRVIIVAINETAPDATACQTLPLIQRRGSLLCMPLAVKTYLDWGMVVNNRKSLDCAKTITNPDAGRAWVVPVVWSSAAHAYLGCSADMYVYRTQQLDCGDALGMLYRVSTVPHDTRTDAGVVTQSLLIDDDTYTDVAGLPLHSLWVNGTLVSRGTSLGPWQGTYLGDRTGAGAVELIVSSGPTTSLRVVHEVCDTATLATNASDIQQLARQNCCVSEHTLRINPRTNKVPRLRLSGPSGQTVYFPERSPQLPDESDRALVVRVYIDDPERDNIKRLDITVAGSRVPGVLTSAAPQYTILLAPADWGDVSTVTFVATDYYDGASEPLVLTLNTIGGNVGDEGDTWTIFKEWGFDKVEGWTGARLNNSLFSFEGLVAAALVAALLMVGLCLGVVVFYRIDFKRIPVVGK